MTKLLTNRKSCWRAGCVAAALLGWMAMGSRLGVAAQKTLRDANQAGVARQKALQGTNQAGVASPAEQANQEDVDAARGTLDRFLDAHPEIEGDVLGDPQRLSDSNYIHDHAELQAFLESHPLVKADPRAFISPEQWRFQHRREDSENLLSWLVPFLVFVCCLLAVLWVLRTVLENRRWNKSFKVHEDVHTKLIDKFSSGQELTTYMESEAGRRLLEWSPPSVEGRMPFAAGRILWSLQAGLILGLAGIGLLLLRDRIPDAVSPLLVCGTLGATIGAGFILSAFISYGISKHLGLLARQGAVGVQLRDAR